MNDTNSRTYRQRLGIRGWAIGGRWGIERYVYTLHRITGLGILAYFLMHIIVTSSIALGQTQWEWWMTLFSALPFKIGEFLVFVAFAFHGLNGIRLVMVELGFAVGPPEAPVYPYRTSLNTQRPLLVVVMLIAGVVILVGAYDFFFLVEAGH
ncbi:MAG: succinate dehydrogenase [Armatimonadota bacterium]|jgi:succinate dehydrogenase / fumarate reductase cytochrome b subunit